MEQNPAILKEKINGKTFMESVLTPHFCYYNCLKGMFEQDGLVGMAHITGGGIKENLNRILPANLNASIDINKIKILPIFKILKKFGNLEDSDMLRTFNMGVGMTAVIKKDFVDKAKKHFKKFDVDVYEIGQITKGKKEVDFGGKLNW
jgi:phosphoribosylformylglycinamidine cyclo-ligase